MASSELKKKKKKSSYKKTSNKTSKSRSKKKNNKNYKKNYPYSKSKKTQTTKTRAAKLENNVSIKIDDKKEKLNYSILDENINNDYKKKKVQNSRKIKTDFNDELEIETLKDEELKVVIEDISNDVIDFDDETPAEIEEKEEVNEEIVSEEDSELEKDDTQDLENEETKESNEETKKLEEVPKKEDLDNIIAINEDIDVINKLIEEIDKDEVEELNIEEPDEIDLDDDLIAPVISSEEKDDEELDNLISISLDSVKEQEENLSDVHEEDLSNVQEEEPIIKDEQELIKDSEILDDSNTEELDILTIESDEDHSGVDESTSERIEAEDIHNISMTDNKEDILESTKIIEEAFDDSNRRAKEIYSHLDDGVIPSSSEDKGYRKFILRLIILIIILLLSIFFIINFSIKYINDSNVKDVNYYESSSIKYTLCNQGNCVEETEINGSYDSVSTTFGYKSKFDEKISYNMNYSVVSLFEIVDPETKDVVFKDEENVLTKEIEAVKTDELKFSQDLDFPITKFREELSKYNEGKDKTYLGNVKLIMYISGINDKKQVSMLTIPLQNDMLKKNVVSYNTGDATITISNKSDSGVIYVCLMIISLSIVIGACIGLIVLLNTSSYDED
ncbi:MAG: hypothetical protein IKE89_05395 [Bacilli bacterium]|nr:hypothetical protein [Bacilli bacterium]